MQNAPNPFSACPVPRWGAYDAPPDPLVGWEGIPHTFRLDAFGASVSQISIIDFPPPRSQTLRFSNSFIPFALSNYQ